MDTLLELAALIRQYNAIGNRIAELTGRPAQIGHLGEYIAARIFDIQLEHAANARSIDGVFSSGPLAGCTVNIKWYAKQENLLDVAAGPPPDHYLILAGPKAVDLSSRGGTRPWLIRSVFLLSSSALAHELARTSVKIGIATSVRAAVWESAMLFPKNRCGSYSLSAEQREQLTVFG